MKQSRVERVERELARYLENEHREYLDKGAKTFCEVKVVGIGREGSNPDVPNVFGGKVSDGPVFGTPVYTHHLCEDLRPRGKKLDVASGESYPMRFIVTGIDGDRFRVVDEREPVDGAGNLESLRALFPDPYFEKVRERGDNRFLSLECEVASRARRHFDMPDAKVIYGSDDCDPPT